MSNRQTITVKHDMQVGHRLWSIPGKCTRLHGHGMIVELQLDPKREVEWERPGVIKDIHEVKRIFRGFLDATFDHRFHFDENDPIVQYLHDGEIEERYPGAVLHDGLPSIENFALWIGKYMQDEFDGYHVQITVHETHINSATWES